MLQTACVLSCVSLVFCDTSAIESFNTSDLYLNGFLLLSLDLQCSKDLSKLGCSDGKLELQCVSWWKYPSVLWSTSVRVFSWLSDSEAKDCTLLPTKHPELATSLSTLVWDWDSWAVPKDVGVTCTFLSLLSTDGKVGDGFCTSISPEGSSSLRSITSREEQVSFLEHLRLGGGKLWPVISMRTWNKQIMNQVGETKINSDRPICTSMAYAVV